MAVIPELFTGLQTVTDIHIGTTCLHIQRLYIYMVHVQIFIEDVQELTA